MSTKIPSGHTTIREKVKTKLTEPPKYAVILLNDNYTTFELVVRVLVQIFRKNIPEAIKITNDVHRIGRGICGLYSKEIAETKIELVEQMTKKEGHPLKCVMEKT